MTDVEELPDGYVRHDRRSPLTDPWEPLFVRRQGSTVQLAVQMREAHCNARGYAHGGLIAALADNAMGLSAVHTSENLETKGAVTVSLSLDYLDSGRVGELLELHPNVLRVGTTLAFVECKALCAGRLIARASATYRML